MMFSTFFSCCLVNLEPLNTIFFGTSQGVALTRSEGLWCNQHYANGKGSDTGCCFFYHYANDGISPEPSHQTSFARTALKLRAPGIATPFLFLISLAAFEASGRADFRMAGAKEANTPAGDPTAFS
jgi:hypothetical protein